MLALLAPRILQSIAVIFVVTTLVFLVSRATGDPISTLAPMTATQEDIDEIKDREGLNDPLISQYGLFLSRAIQLDFGESFRSNRPAMEDVYSRLWATVQLGLVAFVLTIAIGVPIGVLAAVKRGTLPDLIGRLFALIGQAAPNFWLGLMLIFLFAVELGWLPTSGKGDVKHIVLPAITLAAYGAASTMRLTRSAMLEVLGSDYIRTAQAKGLRNLTVIRRHALRNALLPVVTVLGISMGQLLSGSIVVETVFAWPGVGRLMINAIRIADFPVIQAGVIVVAAWIVFVNVIVDYSYHLLDPRVRVGAS